jgi:tetratricopeptide (TPR) repeat protein
MVMEISDLLKKTIENHVYSSQMKKIQLILLCIICTSHLLGQNPTGVKSPTSTLEDYIIDAWTEIHNKEGKQKIEAIIKAGDHIHDTYEDSTCLAFYDKAIDELKSHPDSLIFAKVQKQRSDYYLSVSDYQKTFKYIATGLDFTIDTNTNLMCELLLNLGVALDEVSQYDEAMKNYVRVVRIAETIGDTLSLARATQNIGAEFYYQGDNNQARLQYDKAIHLFESSNNISQAALVKGNVANILINSGYFDSAIIILNDVMQINKQFNNNKTLSNNLGSLASIYYYQDSLDKAIHYYKESLSINKQINNGYGIAFNESCISICYMEKGQLTKAKKYANLSLNKALEINSAELIARAYRRLASLSYDLKEFKKAYEYQRRSEKINDSIYSAEQIREITKLKTQHEMDLNFEKERMHFEAEKTLLKHKSKLRNQTIAIMSIALIIIALIAFKAWTQRKKIENMYEALVQKNTDIVKEGKTNRANISKEDIQPFEDLMVNKKAFLNPEFKISDAASLLNQNSSYLSGMINSYYGNNYSFVVNNYRILHAQELILSGQYLTMSLEGIARESGFRNRGTFHAAFKKHTGITPAIYIKITKNKENKG